MHICVKCKAPISIETWTCSACGWRPHFESGVICLAPSMIANHDGFHEPLFFEYETLEARHFWFAYRRKLILSALQRHFPAFDSFLDVGCGTAENLLAIRAHYPRARLCGAEASLQALRMAMRKCKAQYLQMDARAIPFSDAFDVIGAFDVIEHVEEDELVLREMHRACKAGGGIVLTVPQHPALWSHTDELARHKRRYTRGDLLRKIEAAGFEILDVASFMALLLPAMALSRFRQRASRVSDAMDDGFRIGSMLNRIFGGVCEIERRMIRAGLRFPAGGSLLVAARKRG